MAKMFSYVEMHFSRYSRANSRNQRPVEFQGTGVPGDKEQRTVAMGWGDGGM